MPCFIMLLSILYIIETTIFSSQWDWWPFLGLAFSILFLFDFTDKNALTSLATSTNGDIRAAINAFQIGCATQNYRKKVFEGSTSLQSSKKKAKNSNSSSKNTKGSTLAVIGGKNNKMDLFHAIGKVLYCKRTDEIESREKSLCQNKTRFKLEIDPEELLENIPTSANSFTAFLHQSYTDFFTNMKDLAGAAENLSICDPFFHEWTVS